MTITALPARKEYTATAGQTVFVYDWKIYVSTDLKVFKTTAGAVANDVTDEITGFSVSGVLSDLGGNVTLSSGATVNDLVTIVSDIPETRTVDYVDNADFNEKTVNNDMDRGVSQTKQHYAVKRHPFFQDSQQGVGDIAMEAPVASNFLKYNAAGDAIVNSTISTDGVESVTGVGIDNTDPANPVTVGITLSTESFGVLASASSANNRTNLNTAIQYAISNGVKLKTGSGAYAIDGPAIEITSSFDWELAKDAEFTLSDSQDVNMFEIDSGSTKVVGGIFDSNKANQSAVVGTFHVNNADRVEIIDTELTGSNYADVVVEPDTGAGDIILNNVNFHDSNGFVFTKDAAGDIESIQILGGIMDTSATEFVDCNNLSANLKQFVWKGTACRNPYTGAGSQENVEACDLGNIGSVDIDVVIDMEDGTCGTAIKVKQSGETGIVNIDAVVKNGYRPALTNLISTDIAADWDVTDTGLAASAGTLLDWDGTQTGDASAILDTVFDQSKTYLVTWEVTSVSAGTVKAVIGNVEKNDESFTGVKYALLTPTDASPQLSFVGDVDFVGTIELTAVELYVYGGGAIVLGGVKAGNINLTVSDAWEAITFLGYGATTAISYNRNLNINVSARDIINTVIGSYDGQLSNSKINLNCDDTGNRVIDLKSFYNCKINSLYSGDAGNVYRIARGSQYNIVNVLSDATVPTIDMDAAALNAGNIFSLIAKTATPASSGTGTVKMGSANPADSAVLIPINYNGTTYYVPGWTDATP